MKPQLPSVTLICVDCLNSERAIKVLEHCRKLCDFGAVKFLSSIPTQYENAIKIMPLNSLIAYSVFMLTKFHEYIDTKSCLIIQRDGWILNPQSWNPDWLELDFIGGLYQQYNFVGSGGFSLRSKKIMERVSYTIPSWDGTQKGAEQIQKGLSFYEDGVLTLSPFSKGFKIGSLEQAADFSQAGNRDPKYFRTHSFGWHRTWQDINFKTGEIDSSNVMADLHVTYDHEIDALVP